MGFNQEQLEEHCWVILNSARIRNKPVVLCEGEITQLEGRPSPTTYRRLEKLPDSNFYKACIPLWWKNYLPTFFNCGNRKDVLDTYFTLLDLHKKNIDKSNLTPEILFAILDLDIQIQKVDNYHFPDTSKIFDSLYIKLRVNEENASKHQIWVTGLIHKEAYFLMPDIQVVFDSYCIAPMYNDENILLENIYKEMSEQITQDKDLEENLSIIAKRIGYCEKLDFTNTFQLKESWQQQFRETSNSLEKTELILALLAIKKAKHFWNKIQPDQNWTRPPVSFKEELSLEIGRFYSRQSYDTKYHIHCFFKTLYQFMENSSK